MRVGYLADAPWYSDILASLADTAKVALPLYQQKELMNINADLISRGLPPLDASQYAANVKVGLSDSTKDLILILGGAAALLTIGVVVFGGRRK